MKIRILCDKERELFLKAHREISVTVRTDDGHVVELTVQENGWSLLVDGESQELVNSWGETE